MKKFGLITLILIFSLIALSSCKSVPTPGINGEVNATVEVTTEQDLPTEPSDPLLIPEKVSNNYEDAVSAMDQSICEMLENKEEVSGCKDVINVEFMRTAVEQSNASLCDRITDSATAEECRNTVANPPSAE
jgi:hypothetical protein